jgi:hypothetical protein
MTDERDPKITAAYRELGAEEPPRALDDAILASARRAVGARPGSPGRGAPQRWYASLAAAAVLVLAVAVTLHMQTEQPDIAASPPRVAATPQPAVPAPAKPAADAVAKAVPERAKPKVEALARSDGPRTFVPDPVSPVAPAPQPARQAQAGVQASVPPASVSGATAGEAAERDERADLAREGARPLEESQAPAKRAEAPASALADTPERELERIAGLRAQGRHGEADRALAEFRKRYPEYRIPEQMRARVERR